MKKKTDLKKLAMLGIAGGSILAGQVEANLFDNSGTANLLAYGCGGPSGCHGTSGTSAGNGSAQAPTTQAPTAPKGQVQGQPQQNVPQQVAYGCGGRNSGQGYNYSTSQPAQSSCSGQSRPYYYNNNQSQPQSGCASAQPTSYSSNQAQSGCASAKPTSYNNQRQAQSGCGAQAPQYYSSSQQQPSHGCGAAPARQEQAYNSRPSKTGANFSNTADNKAETPWETQGSTNNVAPNQNGQMYQAPAAPKAPVAPVAPVATPTGGATAYQPKNSKSLTADTAKEAPKVTRGQLSESQLLSQLSPEGKDSYQKLDASGKALALKLVNMTCKGTNDCKGLNACKTEKNSCAGNGGCKGQSPQAFQDINSAVKVASKKMAEKRTATSKA